MAKLKEKVKSSTSSAADLTTEVQNQKKPVVPPNPRIAELESRLRNLLADNAGLTRGVSRGKLRDHTIMANNEHEIGLIRTELRQLGVNPRVSNYR